MSRYTIIQADPGTYREEILEFWEHFLPGTPSGRFDWMAGGNPAGPAIWFLALDGKTGELSGTVSVMPRDLWCRGTKVRAGIMGDFMVRGTDRVFGPGLMLPRAVVARMGELGLDLLYTVPNDESRKIIEKSGFRRCLALKNLVRPVLTEHYVRKYVHVGLARHLAPVTDAALRVMSSLVAPWTRGVVREDAMADESFDALWAGIRKQETALMGERGSAFLNWRYLANPAGAFSILSSRDRHGDVLGYACCSTDAGKLHVHDIKATAERHYRDIIRALYERARAQGCHGMHIQVSEQDPMVAWMRRSLFFDAGDGIDVYAVEPEERIDMGAWHFTGGDRNT